MAENAKVSLGSDTANGYEEDWRQYKRTRNTFLLVFVTYVPVCSTVAVISGKLLGTFTPAFVAAGLWMILFLFYGARLNTWRCPRGSRQRGGTTWVFLRDAASTADCPSMPIPLPLFADYPTVFNTDDTGSHRVEKPLD